MTSKPTEAQHLRELAKLRRVHDRIDREYAEPLDVEALARGVDMSAGHLSLARLAAKGAEVVQEPTEQPYGVRDCAFRDPAGNHLRINERR